MLALLRSWRPEISVNRRKLSINYPQLLQSMLCSKWLMNRLFFWSRPVGFFSCFVLFYFLHAHFFWENVLPWIFWEILNARKINGITFNDALPDLLSILTWNFLGHFWFSLFVSISKRPVSHATSVRGILFGLGFQSQHHLLYNRNCSTLFNSSSKKLHILIYWPLKYCMQFYKTSNICILFKVILMFYR